MSNVTLIITDANNAGVKVNGEAHLTNGVTNGHGDLVMGHDVGNGSAEFDARESNGVGDVEEAGVEPSGQSVMTNGSVDRSEADGVVTEDVAAGVGHDVKVEVKVEVKESDAAAVDGDEEGPREASSSTAGELTATRDV